MKLNNHRANVNKTIADDRLNLLLMALGEHSNAGMGHQYTHKIIRQVLNIFQLTLSYTSVNSVISFNNTQRMIKSCMQILLQHAVTVKCHCSNMF